MGTACRPVQPPPELLTTHPLLGAYFEAADGGFGYPVTMSVRLYLSIGGQSAEEVDAMFAASFKSVTLRVALWTEACSLRFVGTSGEIGQSGRSARTFSVAPSPLSTNELTEEDHHGLPESVRNERKR